MALYEVPTADADILLDLHHLHHPGAAGLSTVMEQQQQQQHPYPNTGFHYAGGQQQLHRQHTEDLPVSSSNSSQLGHPHGHGHSRSLGQVPYSHYSNAHHAAAPRAGAGAGAGASTGGGHSRSFSTNDSTNSSTNTFQNHLAASPYLSAASSAGGDSNPTSRTQTISPLIGHPQLPPQSSSASSSGNSYNDSSYHHRQLSSSQHGGHLQYSSGLGLAGIPEPTPASSTSPSSGAGAGGSAMYSSQVPSSYMHAPQQHSLHGTITPPSPSNGHASSSSHRHSLSDNSSSLSYTPQSYNSTASSLPSSYHTLGSSNSKHSYDPSHSLPSMLPPHLQQHPHYQSHQRSHSHTHSSASASAYPPYPLSYSAQGYMTIYTASPMYGSKDSQINLEVGIAPHEPHHIRGFRVLFGSHGTTTRVVGESRTGEGEERVELAAVTPPIHLTNRIPAHGTTCQLSLQALDEGGKVADWADLGVFEFTDVSSPSKGNKRPGSPLASIRDSPSSSMRPVFPDQIPPYGSPHKRGHSRGSSIGSLVNGFGYMSHQSSHSRNSSMASNLPGEYELQLQQSPQGQQLPLPDKNGNIIGASGVVGHSVQGGPTVWYSTPDGEMIERKPIARLRAPVQPPSSTPASSNLRHPPMEPATEHTPTLYRTSQLPSTGPDGSSNLATKAQLKFEADLNNMALGWSHDEWHAKRRLVYFDRKQDGGIITSSFKPISLQEITPNTIVISCIFREDKNECYVTSVDTIYLLEALVAVRFTVEEKNRIRRNLEGYKPLTITKSKQDCEDFFKVIMSFPNPKPRNIEKDVKVFPWKILSNALKKIISKYSASFLKPEEMVGPGKLPPQPIGWAPGRSPPPPPTASLSLSSNSSPTRQPISLSASYNAPPPAPGTSGSTSSSLNVSPSLRSEIKPFGATSLSLSSNGHHRTSTLGSVAEDETLGSSMNGMNHHIHQDIGDRTITHQHGYTTSDLHNHQLEYDQPDEADELATPHAYAAVGAESENNPFRFH